jgi:hypothetical protein
MLMTIRVMVMRAMREMAVKWPVSSCLGLDDDFAVENVESTGNY